MLNMDVAFLVLLFLDQLHRTFAVAFRETSAMGMLLVIHLGVVAGLFITCPTESSPMWFIAMRLWCAIPSSSAGLRHTPRKGARSAHRHDVRSIYEIRFYIK